MQRRFTSALNQWKLNLMELFLALLLSACIWMAILTDSLIMTWRRLRTTMKSLKGSVLKWVLQWLLLVSLVTLPALGGAQPFVRELKLENPERTLIMSCGRWAQLFTIVAQHGPKRTAQWLQMRESGGTPNDLAFLHEDIWPTLKEHNAASGSFAGAWGICTKNQI